jgi:hypothetical protein
MGLHDLLGLPGDCFRHVGKAAGALVQQLHEVDTGSRRAREAELHDLRTKVLDGSLGRNELAELQLHLALFDAESDFVAKWRKCWLSEASRRMTHILTHFR